MFLANIAIVVTNLISYSYITTAIAIKHYNYIAIYVIFALWYHKQVTIESDGDLHGALIELAHSVSSASDAIHLRSLHIEECVQVMMQRDGCAEPLEPHTSKKRSSSESDGVQQSSRRAKQVRMGRNYLKYDVPITICMQRKEIDPLALICLDKILEKCIKEESIDKEDQPLFIDDENECIKCHWCSLFKGSIEPRVINQHVKTAKSHLKHRKSLLNQSEQMQGATDIRLYFQIRS